MTCVGGHGCVFKNTAAKKTNRLEAFDHIMERRVRNAMRYVLLCPAVFKVKWFGM